MLYSYTHMATMGVTRVKQSGRLIPVWRYPIVAQRSGERGQYVAVMNMHYQGSSRPVPPPPCHSAHEQYANDACGTRPSARTAAAACMCFRGSSMPVPRGRDLPETRQSVMSFCNDRRMIGDITAIQLSLVSFNQGKCRCQCQMWNLYSAFS